MAVKSCPTGLECFFRARTLARVVWILLPCWAVDQPRRLKNQICPLWVSQSAQRELPGYSSRCPRPRWLGWEGGLKLPAFVLVPKDAPPYARLIGLVSQYKRGQTIAPRSWFAEALGCSASSIDSWIQESKVHGFLQRIGRKLIVTEAGAMAWASWTTKGVSKIHRALLSLPRAAQLVHERLQRHQKRKAERGKSRFIPSVRSLAADCGLSPSTVQRSLKALEAAGLMAKLGIVPKRMLRRTLWLHVRVAVLRELPERLRQLASSTANHSSGYDPQTHKYNPVKDPFQPPAQGRQRPQIHKRRGAVSIGEALMGAVIPLFTQARPR